MRKIIILMVLLSLSAVSFSAELTEKSARQLVESMDQAIKRKDMLAIDKLLSPNFKFKLVSRLFGVVDKTETDKEGFLQYTREGLNVAEYYKAKRNSLDIVIQDGKAICSSELAESMVQRGAYISTITTERFVIENVGGALVYTNYEGDLRKK